MNMHMRVDETQLAGSDVRAVGGPAAGLLAADVPDNAPARRRWLRPVLILAAVVVVAAILWAVFGGKGKTAPVAPAATLPTVTVIIPGTTEVADAVTASGSIAARHDSAVGVNGEGGLVTAVLVDAGQSVRKGQVLARLDASVQAQQVASMAAGIRSAKADAALAQSNLDRAAKLVDKGFISKADIDLKTATRDGMNAKVAVAQAQMAEMSARMARLDVRAPAAGLVLSRSVETGQIVGPANNLFRIAEDGVLEMRALVAEQDMARLKVGQPATVHPVGSTIDYHGRIWLLDPVIDANSRQGVARIALAYAPGLRVGAFANTSIAAGATTRPVLPQSAVMVDDAGSFVYVVGGGDGKVVRRDVKVGEVSSKGMSITAGLTGREKVVLSSGAFLSPGEQVKPVTASPASIGTN